VNSVAVQIQNKSYIVVARD